MCKDMCTNSAMWTCSSIHILCMWTPRKHERRCIAVFCGFKHGHIHTQESARDVCMCVSLCVYRSRSLSLSLFCTYMYIYISVHLHINRQMQVRYLDRCVGQTGRQHVSACRWVYLQTHSSTHTHTHTRTHANSFFVSIPVSLSCCIAAYTIIYIYVCM